MGIIIWLKKRKSNSTIRIEGRSLKIKALQLSIARREALLANENYVNKAPAKIVEMDRTKLEEEKKKLEELLK